MLSEEAFCAQNHLCSAQVSVVRCFVSVLMATVPLSPFRRLAFFFNASSSLLLTSQKKKKERKKKEKKNEIYIYISPIMIDKIVTTQALLKHLGVFVWLVFVVFCFSSSPPIRIDTVGGDSRNVWSLETRSIS